MMEWPESPHKHMHEPPQLIVTNVKDPTTPAPPTAAASAAPAPAATVASQTPKTWASLAAAKPAAAPAPVASASPASILTTAAPAAAPAAAQVSVCCCACPRPRLRHLRGCPVHLISNLNAASAVLTACRVYIQPLLLHTCVNGGVALPLNVLNQRSMMSRQNSSSSRSGR